jgi:hypothetical protein
MKTKLIIVACLICTVASSQVQTDKEVLTFISKRFNRVNLSYLIFFEPEMIEYCTDSTNRNNMTKELLQQAKWIDEGNNESAIERKVFLSILRSRIKKFQVEDNEMQKSKAFLLNELSAFSYDSSVVNEQLLENRFNPKKRGLPYGDEECDVDFSFYVFFLYDPTLYINVLKNNRVANPSGKISFPTTCFLEELNNTPLIMKKRTQNELLKILDKYNGADYEILRGEIKKADLSAKFD